jgi:hypothetical protein
MKFFYEMLHEIFVTEGSISSVHNQQDFFYVEIEVSGVCCSQVERSFAYYEVKKPVTTMRLQQLTIRYRYTYILSLNDIDAQ